RRRSSPPEAAAEARAAPDRPIPLRSLKARGKKTCVGSCVLPLHYTDNLGTFLFHAPKMLGETKKAVVSWLGMAPKTIVCPSCGFRNSPPPANHRCGSCGAKMESLGRAMRSREEELERRYQQEGFSLTWMLVSLIVQGVLTAALVIGLPMVVTLFDFEGGNGMLVTIPVWFLGGLLVGLISPGRTFIEPVVASFCAAIPTVFYLVRSQTVRTMPTFMYVIMATIGVLFTLIGSYICE